MSPHTSIRCVIAVAAATLTLTAAGVQPANASNTRNHERAVAIKVLRSAQPAQTYKHLNAAQKSLFKDSMKHQTPGRSYTAYGRIGQSTPPKPGTEPATAVPSSATVNARASWTPPGPLGPIGCYYFYKFQKWSDFGVHDGDTWMQLKWCVRTGHVTRFRVLTAGGDGWSGATYDGIAAKGYRYIYPGPKHVRVLRVFKFHFMGVNFNPCMQMRGGAWGGRRYLKDACRL